MNNINFATATATEMAAAGFTFKRMPNTTKRARKSLFGVKATANKKGCRKAPLAQMNEDFTGTIR